jgi:sugar-specific transcriptional regulator TrmB
MIPTALPNEEKIINAQENETDLSKPGLSMTQAKVYLSLIRLGNTKIKTIANATKIIDRTNFYRTILRLQKTGLFEIC